VGCDAMPRDGHWWPHRRNSRDAPAPKFAWTGSIRAVRQVALPCPHFVAFAARNGWSH